ncbi:MAG TPA: ATP-binding cassette domain-containing protein [Gemmatimonadales bacterium]|nr:ATP-binding cassette domain-containing protein [Gemmatimonadales bacterium]
MTTVLRFEEIPLSRVRRATYGGVPHLEVRSEGVFSLSVARHETVAVVGDETSGVDLLGGLTLGLDTAASGRVTVLGAEPATMDRRSQLAFRRKLGYLPAGDGLMQNLTLRDNIRLPLRFGSDFKPKDIEARVDLIVAQVRLTHVAHLRPAEANAEDNRRAALGRAIALDPELVILEEPFDGLTDRAAAELLETARGGEVAQGGRRTVLITGQDLPALLRHRVERLIRLRRGHAEVPA